MSSLGGSIIIAMRIRPRCPVWAGLAFLSLVLVSPGLAVAQQQSFVLDPRKTTITLALDASLHTVHGTFRATGGSIRFDPASGAASGSIVVDASSGDTGNSMRDHKMHKEVLESDRFPEISFSLARIAGTVADGSTLRAEGTLHIHGDNHPVTLSVPIEIHGDVLTAKLEFQIPYVAWGMKNPSTFVLRVSKEVEVEVVAVGRLEERPH